MAKIAIIGTGIAGNVVAHHLNKQHDISVFEAADYIGGHTHTHNVQWQGEEQTIDTGFIVFNKKNYPNFLKLLNQLRVEYQKTSMSFSVQCRKTGLEYNGNNLNTLFAQRSNLFNHKFHRMIKDILRFNRQGKELLESQDAAIKNQQAISLGDYLIDNNYSKEFIHNYIIPMGGAIWSSDASTMMHFPAQFLLRFFDNHGLLNIQDRPQWYTIKGGSNQYIKPLIQAHKDRIFTSTKVTKIIRGKQKIHLQYDNKQQTFDYVFIATHSDQALKLLGNPTALEKQLLSSIPYIKNSAILHTDTNLLPKRKLAWAAWNAHLNQQDKQKVAVTYNMNILQSLSSKHSYCVTLNDESLIDPQKIIKRMDYAHPQFSLQAIQAQQQHKDINGTLRTFYCGAYWRYGFHEDGVVSALNALKDFERIKQNEKQNLLRQSIA